LGEERMETEVSKRMTEGRVYGIDNGSEIYVSLQPKNILKKAPRVNQLTQFKKADDFAFTWQSD